MKMVYDEYYGHLSYAQRAAYRSLNVTSYEHDRLVEHFGETSHAEITAAVRGASVQGMFNLRLAIGSQY